MKGCIRCGLRWDGEQVGAVYCGDCHRACQSLMTHAVAQERERCARIAEAESVDWSDSMSASACADRIAAKIREGQS